MGTNAPMSWHIGAFFSEMKAYDPKFSVFSGEAMEIETWQEEGTQPFILVIHNESIYSAHDGHTILWLPEGNNYCAR